MHIISAEKSMPWWTCFDKLRKIRTTRPDDKQRFLINLSMTCHQSLEKARWLYAEFINEHSVIWCNSCHIQTNTHQYCRIIFCILINMYIMYICIYFMQWNLVNRFISNRGILQSQILINWPDKIMQES